MIILKDNLLPRRVQRFASGFNFRVRLQGLAQGFETSGLTGRVGSLDSIPVMPEDGTAVHELLSAEGRMQPPAPLTGFQGPMMRDPQTVPNIFRDMGTL